MKKKLASVFLLIITLLNMAFIFYHSAQNAEKSLGTSKEIANTVVSVARGEDKSVGQAEENKEFRRTVNKLNIKMRDFFHAVEYFPMGLCITLLFAINLTIRGRIFVSALLSLIISFLYALSDEIHQHFVPGRTFQLVDITHDAMGFCAGILIAIVIYAIAMREIIPKCKENV